MNKSKPLLIVGLGNPGVKYEQTRHNVGFMAIDKFGVRSLEFEVNWRKEHDALVAKTQLQTLNSKLLTILAKPQTFMNLSGKAVQALMAFYKIPLENIIVIHDDIDLKLGDVRTKTGGGDGGHNGLKSITAAIGNNYKRIRIGVGRPNSNQEPVTSNQWSVVSFIKSQIRNQKSESCMDGAKRCQIINMPVADYVLSKFTSDELKIVDKIISEIEI
ncbi:MAG: aminoacyl-tRNA hydrolase [Alphaproteobacteria bacterium]|nr:aminoacyl-tRNA hydrolase [Alphaproteobacteria bacterium]